MGNGKSLLNTPPKKPEKGERMDASVLANRSEMLNVLPFSGEVNPTFVWRELISDSIQAFAYYRDLEEKDDQIAQCLETRRQGVLSRPRQLAAASDDSDDLKRLAFAHEVLAAIPAFDQVIDGLLDAPAYGVAVCEIIWGMDGQTVFIEALKPRGPEWFLFNPAQDVQNGPLRLKRTMSDMTGEIVPEHKFLVWSFRPRYGNRRGRPLLRRCFWPSWIKRQDIKFWLKWLEKGSGTIAVRASGTGEDDITAALEAAKNIAASTAVGLPSGFEVHEPLLKSARAGSTEQYRVMVAQCEQAIAKMILGATLSSGTGEQGGGAYALGQVHQDVRLEKVAADANGLEAVINDQLLYWLFLFNEGPDVPRPKWTVGVKEPEDLNSRSLVDRRLQMMGLPLTEKFLRESYQVPEPDAADRIVVSENEKFAQMGIKAGGGAVPPEGFSEADGAQRDLSKLERGARERLLRTYSDFVREAIDKLTSDA